MLRLPPGSFVESGRGFSPLSITHYEGPFMKAKTSRRDFLKQTSLAGVGFWVAGGLTLADSKSPNEKLNIACIGVGGKGDGDTDQAAQCGNIVALCDIDDHHLEAKASKFPHAKKYND